MPGLSLDKGQATQELWKGRSHVIVSNATGGMVRLNRTPDADFLFISDMTMVRFSDIEVAVGVAERRLMGQISLEEVKEMGRKF